MEEGHDVRLLAPKSESDTTLRDVDLAQHYGLRHAVQPIFRTLPPTHLGRAWYAMRGRIASTGRIAYTRYGSCAAICVYTGVQTVLELHEVPKLNSRSDLILRRLLRSQSPRLRIVVITEVIRKMLSEQHPYADVGKIIVAPDGVDPVRFESLPNRDQARQILKLPKDKPIVGHVGSLSPTNGVEMLASLVSQMPEIHFVMVGNRGRGGALNYLKEASQNSGTPANLTTPGNVNNAEVPLWMSACDVLLLANRVLPEWENRNAIWTSPLKMFEYMASARPIVASDAPVLREVLDDRYCRFSPIRRHWRLDESY